MGDLPPGTEPLMEATQPSRIRVGIRCRPPFREEMEEEDEEEEGFRPVVVLTPATEEGQMGLVQLRAGAVLRGLTDATHSASSSWRFI